jgi:hypothetical protein
MAFMGRLFPPLKHPIRIHSMQKIQPNRGKIKGWGSHSMFRITEIATHFIAKADPAGNEVKLEDIRQIG